ncbi:MAG: alkaline phosphatase [Acidobacteriota bacterium]
MKPIRLRNIVLGVAQGLLILLALYGVVRFFEWDLLYLMKDRQTSLPDTEPIDFSPAPDATRWPLPQRGLRPKNVILFLGDGMGFSQVAAARFALHGAHQKLFFERFPVVSPMTTFGPDSLYTDSAAGATALATGFKTDPGAIAVDRAGARLRSLFEAAQDRGLSTGIVTDSYLWDASPSAFAIHNNSRKAFDELVAALAKSRVDWMVGTTDDRYDAIAALDALDQPVITDWRDLTSSGAQGEPVIALFDEETIADPEHEPNLPALTELTLLRLSRNPQGFVAFIETEDPDTGSHRHELDRVVRGVGQLEEAVRRAVVWAESEATIPQDPAPATDGDEKRTSEPARAGTLILVTADHETSGLTVVSGSVRRPLTVQWATDGHTGEPVPLYAWGPGAERFSGALDNTEIAGILADLLGLDWTAAR